MSNNNDVRRGTIRYFSDRGWGWIRPDDRTADIWFHCCELEGKRGQRTIEEGVAVTFYMGTRKDRVNAVEVRPIVEVKPTSENIEVGNVRKS
jgi:cold shock CspA family protein